MPITVEIADNYPGDAQKILGFAACDRCAGLRQERRELEESLLKLCMVFHRSSQIAKDQIRETVRASLSSLTKKYTYMVGQWLKTTPQWDESIVDRLMEKPDTVGQVINSLWPHAAPKA